MHTTVYDLDSLRYIIRNLQEENTYLKRILDDNEILYETKDTLDEEKMPDDYDEDQGSRIIPLNPTIEMAKEFYSYFWGAYRCVCKTRQEGRVFS